MIPELSLQWLNHDIPLWVGILAAFTSPALWASNVKEAVGNLFDRYS